MKRSGMVRRGALAWSVALATSFAGASSANAQSITDRVLEEGKITIGIHNQAPRGHAEGEGKAAGVGPDMIEAVLGYPNCK